MLALSERCEMCISQISQGAVTLVIVSNRGLIAVFVGHTRRVSGEVVYVFGPD